MKKTIPVLAVSLIMASGISHLSYAQQNNQNDSLQRNQNNNSQNNQTNDNQQRQNAGGRSSQGINEDGDNRRINAISRRNNNRPSTGEREVRTFDGTNNNLRNTLYGASYTHLVRITSDDYADGISASSGASRPSARVVSNNIVHQDAGVSIPNTFGSSDFLWQWGQFIDHDLGITDGAEEEDNIPVPKGDAWFDPEGTGTQVISFSRAFFDPETGLSRSNPREQENENTAWIDGSMVYGSDAERAAALRVGPDSPYLATSEGNLLPFNTEGLTNANAFGVDATTLFVGGDVRVNEQVGLTVMHTLWVREHNRLAAILASESPRASGEEIFQAARRLVIAKIQIITYEEYLPALIGSKAIPSYRGYDNSINPGLYNEFSVAAYRYGHSLVSENILRLDANGNATADGEISLRDAFFGAPTILTSENSLDPILRGLAGQVCQELDTKANNNLRNFLFGQPGQGGLDLLSLNIQRGRDHGVPAYNAMRRAMGLEPKSSFSDITSDIEVQKALEETYGSVNDIDLWVGGLAEDAVRSSGSQLGELFREMHIFQFGALRDGDRFWYENYLTASERAMVDNTTLASVIRANTDIGNEIQDNVFAVSTP